MTVKEYLEEIANFMTERNGVQYSVKCFNYPVEYVGYGTHSDEPVEYYKPKLEGVIGIVKEGFNPETMFQGYLCYAYQYPEFYEKELFIKCFGPERKLKFEEILNSEIDFDKCHFYGVPKDFQAGRKRK